jgi:hypothetical protein
MRLFPQIIPRMEVLMAREIIGDPYTGAACLTCRYWLPETPRPDRAGGFKGGACHRYPTTLAKFSHEWCGEHRPRPGLAPTGEPSSATEPVAP